MSELDVLRKDIDRLDKEIADLLVSRFAVVKQIGEIKKREGIPVTNTGREGVVIEQVRAAAQDAGEKEALARIYRTVIEESKNLEK